VVENVPLKKKKNMLKKPQLKQLKATTLIGCHKHSQNLPKKTKQNTKTQRGMGCV